ncbi:helix-turn-helix domain-containing protein [Ancylobacter polymorphus]|uniref:Transcriptional regulator with XRE-family HTH domain n=1 Tax=Ancylobacter polymorphus TaxID=223390 RepID=A0ABU0B6G6_9HYPH|nr:helix-turn-helix transcriptional regulator [Ancylobacter polymorphus]MDQ0301408.1 transcriptional regulator with XRE-family HTH domain [Ancylobacter polymorphus]
MLKSRVQERLNALNISQWEAAQRAGLHRNFVYDLLEGRKQKPQQKTLLALARSLQCSVEYLTGASDEIGSPPAASSTDADAGVPVAGVIEDGAWRRPSTTSKGRVLIQPDGRYRGRQIAYIFRGEPSDGLEDGMFVLAVDMQDYEQQVGTPPLNNPVVVELHRKSLNEVQIVIRPWSPGLETSQSSSGIEARVVGVVAATFRLY